MSTKAERFAALQAERATALARRLDELLELRGDERALDVGAGTGALAYALATRVAAVVALDADPAMVDRARAAAPANVEAVVGDGERLPFDDGSFDVAGTLRTLHHTSRPARLSPSCGGSCGPAARSWSPTSSRPTTPATPAR